MSDAPPPHPQAQVQLRRSFQWIWLIPLVAAAVAAFLGWQAIRERGPIVTITFLTADGLQAGQTKVKHKAVELGTVDSIDLSHDMSHVVVRVRMRRQANHELTDAARFWVVRPRLSIGNVSGLDTLLSGAYIELDPGVGGHTRKLEFTGLEEPPAVRSDEPGQSYKLTADRIGSLSTGSPVFFRDIPVGEVLGYDLGPKGDGVTISVFVRSPYDKFVRQATRFWNTSGVSVELGPQGVRLQLESLAAALSGGVAFDTAATGADTPASPPGATFTLYKDEATMLAADVTHRISMLAYFEGSVRGLAVGAPVELYGIQIGTVTGVQLQFDPSGTSPRVAVNFEVQPKTLADPAAPMSQQPDPVQIARRLVRKGLRVGLTTANFLTGQLVLQLVFVPNAPAADVRVENGVIVLPSQAGGLDSITVGLTDIVQKLEALPLDQIAANLNGTLQAVHDVAAGPELKQTLQSMAASMTSINDFMHRLDQGATPALKRLPQIAQSLQTALDRANRLLGSTEAGYGQNSEFNRDLQRLLDQVSDTARSVRLLANYLDQHPDALLRGRAVQSGGR
jgi:paraquat-inducible protein B